MKDTLFINGSQYNFSSPWTLLELITYLGFNPKLIVLDYNGFLLEKQFWAKTLLNDQDSIEVLSIAGGG